MNKAKGFTLLELVAVILLMGIIGLGAYGYLRFGSQVYVDSTAREQVLNQGRFLVERLSRELRNAVPNSIRVSADGDCLEFVPMAGAMQYLDAPVRPASGSQLRALSTLAAPYWDQGLYGSQVWVIINPTQPAQLYGAPGNDQRLAALASIDAEADGTLLLTLAASSRFSKDSPSHRLYLGAAPVSYCRQGQAVYRFDGYGFQASQPLPGGGLAGGALMAEGVQSGVGPLFRYDAPVLQRNAVVHLLLPFSTLSQDAMFFNLEVHIPNVP